MSGIVSGMNYSLLFAPATGSANTSASILNALYNTAPSTGTTTFASTGSPLLDLKIAQQDQTADVAQEALQPEVAQAITAFKNAVAGATSIQNALVNPNVQKVLLTASGLSQYIGETALVQKAFMSDTSDSSSLVNQLGDGTLLSTVSSFNFATTGLAGLNNSKVMSQLTNGYAEVMWRQSLDQATPGLSNAMAFLNQASSIKSVSDILSNQTNFYVITGALGIPTDIVFQDESAQESAISSRLDISKLQDPAYVTSLTDQYLISQQESNPSGSGGSSVSSLLV